MSAAMSERALKIAGVAAVLAIAILIPVIFPGFLVYQISVAITYAIAILGLNLLMGFNGQISVAQGVFFALGAYTTAILITRFGVGYATALPAAVGMATLLGLAVGIPALRLQGLQLAFLTLGLAVLVPPLALKFDNITNGATGISFAKPEAPAWFPGGQDVFMYVICLLGAAVCVLLARRLLHGNTGRALQAVRDNALIAESLGVNLTAVRLSAFATSAAFGGFGGWLFAILNGYVSPESFQMTMSFNFLAGAIIGGITSISGAFIGALFIMFIPDWSADINIALAGVLYGGAMIVMMLVARDGVVGVARNGVRWLMSRWTRPSSVPQQEEPQKRPPIQKVQASGGDIP